MEETSPMLELPGFRFHPTEEELVDFYLRNILHGKKPPYDVIPFLNIYRHHPSELPGMAGIGEREWYFFVPRDRKQGSGGRPNRTTEHGFWKATGSDRKIVRQSSEDNNKRVVIGLRKTLVFYKGRAPRGNKTDWVMNEYRLPDTSISTKDVVLCKIYKKATSLKVLEQRAALEEAIKASRQSSTSTSSSSSPFVSPMDTTTSSYTCQQTSAAVPKREEVENEELVQIQTDGMEVGGGGGGGNNNGSSSSPSSSSRLRVLFGRETLPEIEVPRVTVGDWTQDSFWTQFNSPWLTNLISTPHSTSLNFLSN